MGKIVRGIIEMKSRNWRDYKVGSLRGIKRSPESIIQNYKRKTYQNKSVVLRHLLRNVNMDVYTVSQPEKKGGFVKTFSAKDIQDIKLKEGTL